MNTEYRDIKSIFNNTTRSQLHSQLGIYERNQEKKEKIVSQQNIVNTNANRQVYSEKTKKTATDQNSNTINIRNIKNYPNQYQFATQKKQTHLYQLANPFYQQGLPNGQNVCYLNSIIQVLYGASQLSQKIIQLSNAKQQSIQNDSIIRGLAQIFLSIKRLQTPKIKKNLLMQLIQALKLNSISFQQMKQEDARQFLFNIVAEVFEEQPKLDDQFFKINFCESCDGCGENINIEERYFVDGINKCSNCQKQIVRRFRLSPKYMIIVKSNKNLKKQYTFEMEEDQVQVRYQCCSCIEYYGTGYAGHYVSYRKNSDGIWGYFSDEYTKQYRQDDIFQQSWYHQKNITIGIYQLKQKIDKKQRRKTKNRSRITQQEYTKINEKINQENTAPSLLDQGDQQSDEDFFEPYLAKYEHFHHPQIKNSQALIHQQTYCCLINTFYLKQETTNKILTKKRHIFFTLCNSSNRCSQFRIIIHNFHSFFYCLNVFLVNKSKVQNNVGLIALKKVVKFIQKYLIHRADTYYTKIGRYQFLITQNTKNNSRQSFNEKFNLLPLEYKKQLPKKEPMHYSKSVKQQDQFKQQQVYKIALKAYQVINNRLKIGQITIYFTMTKLCLIQGYQKYLIWILSPLKVCLGNHCSFYFKALENNNKLLQVCKFIEQQLEKICLEFTKNNSKQKLIDKYLWKEKYQAQQKLPPKFLDYTYSQENQEP